MANSKVTSKTVNPSVRAQLYAGLSCVTAATGANLYAPVKVNFFDVPNEEYVEGKLTGLRVAFEVLSVARDGDDSGAFLQSIVKAAVKTSLDAEGRSISVKDGSGAANGFLIAMCELLEIAAKKLDLGEFMTEQFHDYEEMMADSLDEMKKKNVAILKSMTRSTASAGA